MESVNHPPYDTTDFDAEDHEDWAAILECLRRGESVERRLLELGRLDLTDRVAKIPGQARL